MMSRNDDGFTIVEAIVALVIIFGAVLVMLRSIDTGARVLYETKRQSGAAALASELIERVRSLEWANMGLTVGANSTNCTLPATVGDPPQGVGCTLFAPDFGSEVTGVSGGYEFGGEPVVFSTGMTFDPFLSFHQQVTRDKTVFDRYLFITSVRTTKSDPATERYRRITAIVRWNATGGFRKEVRLASYVSPFTEPSLPFISAEVNYTGGFGQIEGRVLGVAGWGQKRAKELDEQIVASLPSGRITATSDYVSSATARMEGMSGYWTQAGGDGVFGSGSGDDVELLAVNPEVVDLLSDDDGTSATPVQTVMAADIDLARFEATQDMTRIAEVAGAMPKDHSSVLTPGRVSTVDTTDDLPYGTVTGQAAARVVIDRVEDWTGVPEAAYAAASKSLTNTQHTFTFYRYGDHSDSTALGWSGTADRQDDATTGLRKATAAFSWKGQELDLLDDEVLSASDNAFNGWVVINLPSVWNQGTNAPLEAGEYYSALNPGIGVKSGGLTVEYWDGSSYATLFSASSIPADCLSEPTALLASEASPLTLDVAEAGYPSLHYEVWGSLTVNHMCVSPTQQYGTGEVRSNSVSATDMVSGTLHYKVVDTVGQTAIGGGDAEEKATLFNLTMTFSTGGVSATAAYINPELS